MLKKVKLWLIEIKEMFTYEWFPQDRDHLRKDLFEQIEKSAKEIKDLLETIEIQDQRDLDRQRQIEILEKQISDLKLNPESISPYIRHLLKVTLPGATKYDDDDFKDSERTFYAEANDVAKNDSFKIVIGKMSQGELENTFIQSALTTDLSKLGMTRTERIAFGEGALHGIALVKEEFDRLSTIYQERLEGSKPITDAEKFEPM